MVKERSLDNHRIQFILNCVMYDLGMIGQNTVNRMNLPDERARATAYITIITNLVDTVSEMMKELNRLGVEKINGKYSAKIATPKPKNIIV